MILSHDACQLHISSSRQDCMLQCRALRPEPAARLTATLCRIHWPASAVRSTTWSGRTAHRKRFAGYLRNQTQALQLLQPVAAVGAHNPSSSPSSGTASPGTGNSSDPLLSSSSSPGVMDNSSLASIDWNDWMTASSSSSSDTENILLPPLLGASNPVNGTAALLINGGTLNGGGGGGSNGSGTASTAMPSAAAAAAPAAGLSSTVRIAFYAIAASFDRRQLETRLKAAYGNSTVRKYPDVIHCQMPRQGEAHSGADVFFFDYGVVACWEMSQDLERHLVRDIAVQCAVQSLPESDHEQDVFRCTFTTNPLETTAAAAATGGQPRPHPPPPPPSTAPPDASDSLFDVETPSATSSTGGTTSNRRYPRRADRSTASTGAAAGPSAVQPAAAQPTEPLPPAAGPYSFLSFPPQITDDTVLLHVRHRGDTATLLAVSYALAQSTKMSAFEKAVATLVEDTKGLPEALAEHGEVHLSSKEIGRLIGKVFVLKRSVNLLGSVASTPEFFWYAPDQLQLLYSRVTEYVELAARVEQLNSRFAVLQEMLELLRAQEENRHGNRLELVVIWLIVVEVVLGVFELLELFGVIGPKNGF